MTSVASSSHSTAGVRLRLSQLILLALAIAVSASSVAAFPFPRPVGYSYIDKVSEQRYADQPFTNEVMMKGLVHAPVGAAFDKYIDVFYLDPANFQVLTPGVGRGHVGLVRSVPALDFDEEIQAAGEPTTNNREIASVTYKVTRPNGRTLDQLGFTRFVPVSENLTEIVWSFKLVMAPQFTDNAAFLAGLEDTVYGVLLSVVAAFPAPPGTPGTPSTPQPTRYALPAGYSYVDTASAQTYERQPGHEIVVKQVVNAPIDKAYDTFVKNEWVKNSGAKVTTPGEGRARIGLTRTVTGLGYTERIVAAGLPTKNSTAVASMTYQIVQGVVPGVDQLGFVRFIPLSKRQTEIVWTIKLVLTPEPTPLFPNSQAFYSFLSQAVAGILAGIAKSV